MSEGRHIRILKAILIAFFILSRINMIFKYNEFVIRSQQDKPKVKKRGDKICI